MTHVHVLNTNMVCNYEQQKCVLTSTKIEENKLYCTMYYIHTYLNVIDIYFECKCFRLGLQFVMQLQNYIPNESQVKLLKVFCSGVKQFVYVKFPDSGQRILLVCSGLRQLLKSLLIRDVLSVWIKMWPVQNATNQLIDYKQMIDVCLHPIIKPYVAWHGMNMRSQQKKNKISLDMFI